MQAVGGGSWAAFFALIVLVLGISVLLLFYGSVIAAIRKQSKGLLIGLIMIFLGGTLLFYGYPSYEYGKTIRQIGLAITYVGSLVYSISNLLYIKKVRA